MSSPLIRVEEKIAHLERYVGELDQVVREMNDRLDGFTRQLAELRRSVEAGQDKGESSAPDGDGGGPGPWGAEQTDRELEDDRPPHW